MKTKINVGVIGSGAISDIYLTNMINRFDNLEVCAVSARRYENAVKKANKYGIKAYTNEQMFEDDDIEMVVVLTPVSTHYGLIKAALLAGKHVYTEKTITDDPVLAKELLDIAGEKNLYLGAAPDTFLGGAWQTARKAIDDGMLGTINSFAISGNRDNDVLTAMFPFLREPGAGILYDYSVYYMTTLVSLLGPVSEVGAMIAAPVTSRKCIIKESAEYGQEYATPNESEVSAIIKLESSVTGTFHVDAESHVNDKAFYAIYGTKGILYLTDPNGFGGEVVFLNNPKDWSVPNEPEKLEYYKDYCDNSRGIGPSEMADAILTGRKCRASKELAYHVLDVLNSMLLSNDKKSIVQVKSSVERPERYL